MFVVRRWRFAFGMLHVGVRFRGLVMLSWWGSFRCDRVCRVLLLCLLSCCVFCEFFVLYRCFAV